MTMRLADDSAWWSVVHVAAAGVNGALMPQEPLPVLAILAVTFSAAAAMAWVTQGHSHLQIASVLSTGLLVALTSSLRWSVEEATITMIACIYLWEVLEWKLDLSAEEVADTVLDVALGLFSFLLCYTASSPSPVDGPPNWYEMGAYTLAGAVAGCLCNASKHYAAAVQTAALTIEVTRGILHSMGWLQHAYNLAWLSLAYAITLEITIYKRNKQDSGFRLDSLPGTLALPPRAFALP